MTLTDEELAVENDVESVSLLKLRTRDWKVEVYRNLDEPDSHVHIDVETFEVFEPPVFTEFVDAVSDALAFVEKWRGGGHV